MTNTTNHQRVVHTMQTVKNFIGMWIIVLLFHAVIQKHAFEKRAVPFASTLKQMLSRHLCSAPIIQTIIVCCQFPKRDGRGTTIRSSAQRKRIAWTTAYNGSRIRTSTKPEGPQQGHTFLYLARKRGRGNRWIVSTPAMQPLPSGKPQHGHVEMRPSSLVPSATRFRGSARSLYT